MKKANYPYATVEVDHQEPKNVVGKCYTLFKNNTRMYVHGTVRHSNTCPHPVDLIFH